MSMIILTLTQFMIFPPTYIYLRTVIILKLFGLMVDGGGGSYIVGSYVGYLSALMSDGKEDILPS